VPLAEIGVDLEFMKAFLGKPVTDLPTVCEWWKTAGYDYTLLQVRGQPLPDSAQEKIADGVFRNDGPDTASSFDPHGVHDDQSFESYPWISPEAIYFKDVDLIKKCLPEGMKLVVCVGPIFRGILGCMGFEGFAVARVENPALVKAVADKMGQITVSAVENLVQRDYVGGIWLGDDSAYTQGLMASPDFFRTYIYPYYTQIGKLCRWHQKLYLYHSDGQLLEVFDDLIGCGIQAIHPNEPTSVDIAELKQEWGDRLAFVGNIDMDMLSRGTPEQIVEATRYLLEKVAPGGGYALSSGNSLSKYVSVANYRAMLESAGKYGAIY
jgi:uroporphyrinogen decarboxylase